MMTRTHDHAKTTTRLAMVSALVFLATSSLVFVVGRVLDNSESVKSPLAFLATPGPCPDGCTAELYEGPLPWTTREAPPETVLSWSVAEVVGNASALDLSGESCCSMRQSAEPISFSTRPTPVQALSARRPELPTTVDAPTELTATLAIPPAGADFRTAGDEIQSVVRKRLEGPLRALAVTQFGVQPYRKLVVEYTVDAGCEVALEGLHIVGDGSEEAEESVRRVVQRALAGKLEASGCGEDEAALRGEISVVLM